MLPCVSPLLPQNGWMAVSQAALCSCHKGVTAQLDSAWGPGAPVLRWLSQQVGLQTQCITTLYSLYAALVSSSLPQVRHDQHTKPYTWHTAALGCTGRVPEQSSRPLRGKRSRHCSLLRSQPCTCPPLLRSLQMCRAHDIATAALCVSVTPANCLTLMTAASTAGADSVYRAARACALDHFTSYVTTRRSELNRLSLETLVSLLSDDDLQVCGHTHTHTHTHTRTALMLMPCFAGPYSHC